MHREAMHLGFLVDDYLIEHYAPKDDRSDGDICKGEYTDKRREKEQRRSAKLHLCKYRPKAGGESKNLFSSVNVQRTITEREG